jgi:Mlc titration factor MtfA (ptsG expression regulator)
MGWIRRLLRRRVGARPLPPEWRQILAVHVPFAERLPVSLRPKFEADLMVFEHEKLFVGAGGFEVTEKAQLFWPRAKLRNLESTPKD